MDDQALVPRRSPVGGGADPQVLPVLGRGGGREQQRAVGARGIGPQEGSLDDGRDQPDLVRVGAGERLAAVGRGGPEPVPLVRAVLIAAGEHDRAVRQLRTGGLAGVHRRRAGGVHGTDPPGPPAVVAEQHVGAVAVGGIGMVGGGHQTAGVGPVLQLERMAGPDAVPAPRRLLDVRGDVVGRGPRGPAVVTGQEPGPAGVRAGAGEDLDLGVRAVLVGGQDHQPAALPVQHRGRVAHEVGAVVGDHLQGTPGAALVGGPLGHQVHVAVIRGGAHPALGEGEEATVGAGDDGRDAEGGVPVLPGTEHRGGGGLGGGAVRHRRGGGGRGGIRPGVRVPVAARGAGGQGHRPQQGSEQHAHGHGGGHHRIVPTATAAKDPTMTTRTLSEPPLRRRAAAARSWAG